MSARGISPHVDWVNLGTDELLKADFPLYVYDQKVGDLVVFPPATAHQVWNPATLSTKLVWNILHPLSLEVGFQYVQPPFNRLCHPDVARTHLSLAHAMLSLARDDAPGILPPDLPLLSRLFRQMVHDESIEGQPATPITWVQVPETVVATCNFCSTAIWNRHVRCSECIDFDLCLACYLSGRSCEHSQSYSWAEIHPPDRCTRILVRAREILGFQPEEPHTLDRKKTLGTAVNDLMKGRQNTVTRLCHLCRIDHPEWKGRRCDKCTAFFCFRGLYRHFDMNSADVIRHSGLWTCPKCSEICNCRCCHFSTAYAKAEKPASKRRVKPSDPRGKIMGFTDNVFDQKRGQRIGNAAPNGNPSDLPSVSQVSGQKRRISMSDLTNQGRPLRTLEFPALEPENTGPEYVLDAHFASATRHRLGGLSSNGSSDAGPTLPGIASLPQHHVSSANSRVATGTSTGEGMKTLASAAASHGRTSALSKTSSVPSSLPPLTTFDIHNPYNASTQNGKQRRDLNQSLSVDSSKDTSIVDAAIAQKENRIAKLRRYGDELIQLGLKDSHKVLSQELLALEADLRAVKKQKSAALIENLRMEFPGLADVARKEVEKLGYA
jgi:Zinc-finger domain of monoamine-oxidase A repressor R1/Zinc finger, ZZ type